MHIKFDKAMIVRVYPAESEKGRAVGRCYLTLLDLSAGGCKFECSQDHAPVVELSQQLNVISSIEGDFETFEYDGRTSFKLSQVGFVIKPIK